MRLPAVSCALRFERGSLDSWKPALASFCSMITARSAPSLPNYYAVYGEAATAFGTSFTARLLSFLFNHTRMKYTQQACVNTALALLATYLHGNVAGLAPRSATSRPDMQPPH